MSEKNKSLALTHIAIFLFGSAGLFGKLINQPAFAIVFGRVFFSVIIMFIVFKIKHVSLKFSDKKDYAVVILMGLILSVHWVLFYHSVQISTVAISLLTFSTCSIFATFMEPIFFKEKLKKENIIVALVAFAGVVFVAPNVELSSGMFQGFVEGILAGFTFALVTILERKYVKHYSGVVISFYEQVVVFIVLIPVIVLTGLNPVSKSDIAYILLLSIVFTLLSRYCYITGLKGVSAQTASVLTSLEPIYGIILAVPVLGEIPTIREIIGGFIIISAAIYSSTMFIKKEKTE